jgi:glucose-6-phosphate isomerase
MIRLQAETVEILQSELTENRTALKSLLARKDLGFFDLPARTELWNQCSLRAKNVLAQADHLAVLGIGGSSLGGRALMDSLALKTVDFFENVDARDFWERLRNLKDLKRTHWAIISKSGSTIETLGQMSFVSQFLKEQGLSLNDKVTVITEKKKSPLYDWAIENEVPTLEVPLDVGGRFSVLSPVGLFPAAFAGIDLDLLRKGALWALQQDDLISRLMAQSLRSFAREEWITPFWIYSSRLWSWGLWVQQLWAESLAKKIDRAGKPGPRVSTPLPLIGANDQHSILQLIAEGARDKFIWFVRVTDAETFGPKLEKSLFEHQRYLQGKSLGALLAAEVQATAQALQQNQIQSLCVEVRDINPMTMGALFMLLELVVGALGESLNINAFDQPGVELGKRLALDILK